MNPSIALALFGFALLPGAQAVVPPPDGGYPNFTTAEGTKALQNLTTGAGNTGVGWYSLFSVSAAGFNTGVGAGTLVLNIADQNTAIGAGALLSNTTGYINTANGAFALIHNSTGFEDCVAGFIWFAVPQPTKWQRIGKSDRRRDDFCVAGLRKRALD